MTTKSYLVLIKSKNIFSSTINKVFLFSKLINAYEFGINYDPFIKKGKINSLEEAVVSNLIWTSKNGFPKWKCKIYPIDNDLICNIYQGLDQEKYLIQGLYKNLLINELL